MSVQPQNSVPSHADRWLAAHGDALWRYALSRVPPAAAEDLVQECLLAALKAHDGFDARSSIETWLLGILSHKVADYYRRRAREREGEQQIGERLPAAERERELFDASGRWVRCEDDEWREVSDDELRGYLDECREHLPPLLRDALELRELRQLPGEVVCQALGITPTNLWTRLHRARLLLRRCIDASIRSRGGSGLP